MRLEGNTMEAREWEASYRPCDFLPRTPCKHVWNPTEKGGKEEKIKKEDNERK
jgi:hypothetical protein